MTRISRGRHLGLELDELCAADEGLGQARPAHAPVEVLLQLQEHEPELKGLRAKASEQTSHQQLQLQEHEPELPRPRPATSQPQPAPAPPR